MFRLMKNRPWLKQLHTFRYSDTGDGDGTGTGTGTGGGSGGGAGAGGGSGDGTNPYKFTPEQQKAVNDLISNTKHAAKKAAKEENEKLAAQLETLSKKVGLSEQEKADVLSQIDRLKTEHMSKEELAQGEYKKNLDRVTNERKEFEEKYTKTQTQFERYRVETELVKAASDAKAYRIQQIVDMFSGRTKVLPKMDGEGKVIDGAFDVKMELNLDGKALSVSPTEAMKLLKEHKDYANLFAGEGTGGLGGAGGSSGTGQVDLAQIETWMKDPVQYQKHRAEIHAFLQKGKK